MEKYLNKTPKQILYSVLWLFLLISGCHRSENNSDILNILLIVTDDQGWGDLGYHGNEIISTPHIDQLSKQGTSFERFYVSPVCAPTRASILTGRYHLRTGVSWVTHRYEVMRESEVTIAEILKENGYQTSCIGKWHNGNQYPNNPLGQGFDYFYGFMEGHFNNYFNSKLIENEQEVSFEGYLPDVLTDKAIQIIKQNDQPFFCYLAYNTPHSPFQVPDKYFNKYKSAGLNDKDATVYGMVENIDDNVGRILQTLDEQQLTDNTLVILMSDNGPNGHRYNGEFKGIKGHVDEGGVRVPFIIRYPNGQFSSRVVENNFATHIDLLPTILELCGLDVPDKIQMDGRSLVPLLQGESSEWNDRFFYTHHTRFRPDTFPGAIRNTQYLLTLDEGKRELYDLQKDPFQKHNIADDYPDVKNSLEKHYINWYKNVTMEGLTPPAIPIGYKESLKVILPAQEAALFGTLIFQGEMGWANDWVKGFHSYGDSMVWNMEVIQDGNYQISVKLASGKNMIGNAISLSSQGNTINYEIENLYPAKVIYSPDRVVRTEVHERSWSKVNIDTLSLRKGETTLNLHVAHSKDSIDLEIKEIEIINID